MAKHSVKITRVASLGGGSSFNLQIPYTEMKEGANSLQVIADVQNGVAESDETNNSKTFDFTAESSRGRISPSRPKTALR